MKIAIILPTIISKNGTSKQAVELALQLKKSGDKVTFITFAYCKETTFPEFAYFKVLYVINVEEGIIYKKLTKNVGKLENIYLHIGLINILKIVHILKKGKYEIINPHDWFGLWATKLAKSKNIIANINDVPQRSDSGLISTLKLFLDRAGIEKIKKIIVLDTMNQQRAIEWLQISKDNIEVVRSGIDIEKYRNFKDRVDLRKQYNLQKKSFILICANILAPNRRYEEVIEAISIVRNPYIHLFILSKLDFNLKYAASLKKITEEKGLSQNVHFIDTFFTDKERMEYIAGGDVLIFPNYPQTWGLTAIEAMALGIPVIVSKGSGVSEVITNQKTGILFNKGDVKGLTQLLRELTADRVLLKKIASAGKEYVMENYSWEKFGKEVRRIFTVYVEK